MRKFILTLAAVPLLTLAAAAYKRHDVEAHTITLKGADGTEHTAPV